MSENTSLKQANSAFRDGVSSAHLVRLTLVIFAISAQSFCIYAGSLAPDTDHQKVESVVVLEAQVESNESDEKSFGSASVLLREWHQLRVFKFGSVFGDFRLIEYEPDPD